MPSSAEHILIEPLIWDKITSTQIQPGPSNELSSSYVTDIQLMNLTKLHKERYRSFI